MKRGQCVRMTGLFLCSLQQVPRVMRRSLLLAGQSVYEAYGFCVAVLVVVCFTNRGDAF